MAELAAEADAIDGLPLPREQQALYGHDAAARALHEAYAGGRMHHAWLLAGPKGIGKATLAFRFARFALSHPDPAKAPPAGSEPLAPVDPRVAAQVARGAHPNVLHLARPLADDGKRFKTQLTVDEVRRTVGFFGNTAGGQGFRIAIVDTADDMNASAANALLKMLEEPPARALFLVLSNSPGRLLPTIRSRCRRLALGPLAADELDAAVAGLGLEVAPAGREALFRLAEGSPRRAAECLEGEALTLAAAFDDLARGFPKPDRRAVHRFADAAAGRKGSDDLAMVGELARRWLSDTMRRRSAGGPAAVRRFAEAWAEVDRILAETEGLNLDRKQAVLDLVLCLAKTAEG